MTPYPVPNPLIVSAAAERLSGVAHHTPVITSRTVDTVTGARIHFKCENFQRVGAFKFRGAYNALSQLNRDQAARGVVTHSSGNHAQGVALAAHLLSIPATVVMPEDAPSFKREATLGYGAHVITCPAVDREAVSAQLVAEEGLTLIHPYDNESIIAGQGTAAWELFADVGPLDYLFVPVGGGGLISGSSLAAAALSPRCRVVGVEPLSGDDGGRSWRSGDIVELDAVPVTIADGLRTRFIGKRNLAIMRHYVDDMVTVTDEAILAALDFIWTRLKIVVEPSAAAAFAPLLPRHFPFDQPEPRVGVIFSGGNVAVQLANSDRPGSS